MIDTEIKLQNAVTGEIRTFKPVRTTDDEETYSISLPSGNWLICDDVTIPANVALSSAKPL